MRKLYTDGGVILKNPSTIGGTWAYILIDEDGETVIHKDSGYVTHRDMCSDGTVTNNQTELLAMVKGLRCLPYDWVIEVCCDSEITLGRIFKGFSFNNIPAWLLRDTIAEKRRLRLSAFEYTLMDGHPTLEQVRKGTGKKGHVTSKWNVWCDKECGRQAQLALSELGV